MREIKTHTLDPNDPLRLVAYDAPSFGGANHLYILTGMDFEKSTVSPDEIDDTEFPEEANFVPICFQHGPILEHGVNGVTNESLLAIVKDRLEAFQAGQFKCDENAAALTAVNLALECLHSRTANRIKRGVEGQNKE